MCWKMHYMTWWPLGSMWGQHLRGHWSSTKSHAAWMKWAWDLAWPPSTLLAVLEISSNLTGNDHVLGSFDSWYQVRKILQHSRSLNYMVILSSFTFSQTPWYPTSTWCHQTQLLLHSTICATVNLLQRWWRTQTAAITSNWCKNRAHVQIDENGWHSLLCSLSQLSGSDLDGIVAVIPYL